MPNDERPERHVFSDPDAAQIYQGLMVLLGAIEDLKDIIERTHRAVIDRWDA